MGEKNEPTFRERIGQFLAENQARAALELCESLQMDETLPPGFWYCKGEVLEHLGEKALAAEAYRCEIAALKSPPPGFLVHVGSLLRDTGRWAEAAVCLKQACDSDPTPHGLVFLASALGHLGRWEEAIEALRMAIELEPDFDEPWLNLGGYYLEEDPAEAEKAIARAVELDPQCAANHGGLALVYLEQRRLEHALGAAERGLEIDPTCGQCYQVAGEALALMGEWDRAEEMFRKGYRCDYDKPQALLGLARSLESQGRLEDAEREHRRAVRAWPDEDRVHNSYTKFVQKHEEYAHLRPELLANWERVKRMLRVED